jgi:hypothetical protein
MITVAILINGHPIVAKNAVNQMQLNDKGECSYLTDAGEIIWHKREAGAVALAHMLLDTIRNDGSTREQAPKKKKTKTKNR